MSTMPNHPASRLRGELTNRILLLAMIALGAGTGAGCDKEGVDQKARELEVVKKDLRNAKDSVKSTVQESAERAKAGVAKLHEQLPEVQENAREKLETAKESLRETRDKVVDTVKGTLNSASDKVDEAVEKAQRAGE